MAAVGETSIPIRASAGRPGLTPCPIRTTLGVRCTTAKRASRARGDIYEFTLRARASARLENGFMSKVAVSTLLAAPALLAGALLLVRAMIKTCG